MSMTAVSFRVERSGAGFRVSYAIADVGSFVPPGGAVDAAARSRGETLYLPDGRVPLRPSSCRAERRRNRTS